MNVQYMYQEYDGIHSFNLQFAQKLQTDEDYINKYECSMCVPGMLHYYNIL